jgi:hypothetical protein
MEEIHWEWVEFIGGRGGASKESWRTFIGKFQKEKSEKNLKKIYTKNMEKSCGNVRWN